MKLKRITALALSLCMAAGLISGCGKDNKEKDNTGTATGKYVEEDVEVPIEQAEVPLALTKNVKGEIEVYTVNEESGVCAKYVSKEGKEWSKEDASWIQDKYNGYLTSVIAGADGNNYAIVQDAEMKMHLLKQTGEGTAEEISIPELNEASDTDINTEYYSFGTDLYVMENGNIVLAGVEGAKVYSPENGEVLHTFPYTKSSTDSTNPISINGENIALPSKNNHGFTVWNIEQEKEVVSTDYGSDVRSGKIILEENNEMYFLNTDGIHHMNPDGTLVETLVDGSSMTMGTPSAYIMGFTKGSADDFYVLYVAQNMMLKHYYYDKDAKTVADKKLSIYSLEENDTIRQAVSVFQQEHPDVEISYKTGESDSSTTRADQIRVLNTELLNKSGADVLVLDNLPVDSFIEKNVLKDISNVINPLIEDGTLQKNIAECYLQEDGKVYGMPVRYGVPILFGNQEMLDALGSLDTLENWLDTHEGEKIITLGSYGELTRLFVNMYYDEIFDENGKLKENKLKQCISCAKRIGELYDAQVENNYIDDETGENLADIPGVHLSDWSAGDDIAVAEEPQVSATELLSIFDMMIPFKIMRENSLPLLFNRDTFVPYGVVGINSASENTELAEEFLKTLFSDEVQNCNLMDGLPVNQNAAVQMKEMGIDSLEAVGEEGMSTSVVQVGGDEEENVYNFTMPLKSEIEELMQRTAELKQPAKTDSVLLEMIMEEAAAYYEGSQELDAVVQAIINKVDTYRAE